MAERSIVEIMLRARGGRAVASETRVAATGVDRLGRAANVADRGLGRLGTTARYAAGALGTYGLYRGLRLAAGAGLSFNATMEQNQVAFKQFLGSSRAANQELATLYDIAKRTPFEFPELTMAARRLLAVGFAAKDANSLLTTIGDTVSGLGVGAEGIDRMVTALGQIRSKGRLQTEELMQLQELGAVDTNDLRKRLGLTRDEMADLGNQGVSANKAIKALKTQWDETFGGASAKQSATFSGQISTLRDNVNQLAGSATKPLFNKLRDDVLPVANDLSTKLNSVFNDKDLSLEQKFQRAGMVIRRQGKPLVDDIVGGLQDANLDDRLEGAVEWAIPKIADGFAAAGPRAAKVFVDAWLASGPWGKLATALFIAYKGRGLIGALGKGGGGVAGALGKTRGMTPANPLFVADVTGGGIPGRGKNPLDKTPRWAKGVKTGLKVAGPLAAAYGIGEGLHQLGVLPYGRNNPTTGMAAARRRAAVGPGSGVAGQPPASAKTSVTVDGRTYPVDPRLANYPDSHRTPTVARPVHLNVTAPIQLKLTDKGKPLAEAMATFNVSTRERNHR